jgi:hypothetical protein
MNWSLACADSRRPPASNHRPSGSNVADWPGVVAGRWVCIFRTISTLATATRSFNVLAHVLKAIHNAAAPIVRFNTFALSMRSPNSFGV